MADKKFYTVQEVADLFKVHRMTIYRRIKDGSIKTVRLSPGGAIRIPASIVEKIAGIYVNEEAQSE